MDKRTLKSIQYQLLVQGFKQWLTTLSYAESTIYGHPKQIQEFLLWLEDKKHFKINEITQQLTEEFITYFKNRPNRKRAGGISISHVNKQINILNKFFQYLDVTNKYNQKMVLKQLKEVAIIKREILTKQEIQQLYDATLIPSNGIGHLIGMRDRAMLAVYYGCGIRKKEGIELEVSDVLFERRLLYVRSPKNGYERYVPINFKALQDLEIYIYQARPLLLTSNHNCDALFISERGTPIKGVSLICRLNALKEKCGNPVLQNRSFGLHALRHSIATHLLQAGMELENIALFLGHKTLDSTQLYTHLINE